MAQSSSAHWPLKGKPFQVQSVALERSLDQPGYNWFMEQGLGKTPVAMADYLRLERAGLVDAMAVVCPNSLKTNWEDMGAEWEANIKFALWGNRGWSVDPKKANGFIINYEAVLQSGGDALREVLETRRCHLDLDESQRIKNYNSNTTRRILGDLGKSAVFKRCLSGTPMTLTPADFWPQLRFAGAIEGSNAVAFRHRYCVEVPGHKGHKKFVGTKNEEELRGIIESCSFRATKEEWAKDLPAKLYRPPVRIAMPDKLKQYYIDMLDEFVLMLESGDAIVAEAVATQYLKLQQISSGFVYDSEREAHPLMPVRQLPKFQALMDVIDANGPKSKTLVFAHFRHTCTSLIGAITEETGQLPAFLIGGMKDEETRAQKASFNSSAGPQVMVLQLAAGKEGHTLLGDQDGNPCHTVCYYENNFNLGDRLQSEDRPHRYGQKNNVLYVDFSCSPIESHVIRAYQSKKALVAYLLDNKDKTAA